MKYSEQLKDKRWRRKREKILLRDKYACTKCNSTESLNVHHLYYISGNYAWEYPHNALIVLCRDCHKQWHDENIVEIRKKKWSKNEEYCPFTKKKGRGKPKKKQNRKPYISEELRIRRKIVGWMGGKGSKVKINLICGCNISEYEKTNLALIAKPMTSKELIEYIKYKGYLEKKIQEV